MSATSPINNLAAIQHLALLYKLYGTVLIPEAVYRELTEPDFPVAGATEVQTLNWIQTIPVSNVTLVNALSTELDIGRSKLKKNVLNRRPDDTLMIAFLLCNMLAQSSN